MVPGREVGLLSEAARQIEMIDAYLLQRRHGETVIDFTGSATADFSIAVAGLNWLTPALNWPASIQPDNPVPYAIFRKLVTLAHR